MPHFAIIARDAPDSAAKRDAHRAAHFARVEQIMGQVAVAGPLKDDKGVIIGSLIVLDVADAAEARSLLESDPYFAAGVWADIEIQPFLAAAGTWIGGKIW
ncbi:YciI family protein [Sphingomonas sp.]|jgi:hypothetical protein|uniref:YciI family protein n=1 Tax=Sphingomonas sp. TaxID=28214 RepID=UPI002DEC9468|nr:YciI family protein [Sphingomonas sp.]